MYELKVFGLLSEPFYVTDLVSDGHARTVAQKFLRQGAQQIEIYEEDEDDENILHLVLDIYPVH